MPLSAAATTPIHGIPTNAAHDPATVASATNDNTNEVDRETAIVEPRRSPPSGSKGRNASDTGNNRSPASATGSTRRLISVSEATATATGAW